MALALVMALRDQDAEVPKALPTPVSAAPSGNTLDWSFENNSTSQWWTADTRDRACWSSPRPLNLRQYDLGRPTRSREDAEDGGGPTTLGILI